jgi:hypothetical protein
LDPKCKSFEIIKKAEKKKEEKRKNTKKAQGKQSGPAPGSHF